MRNFILRVILNAVAIALLVALLPGGGIRVVAETQQDYVQTLVIVAIIFGLVNAVIKPVLTFLTCPFIFFTLGLFLLVINGAMFMLTAWLSQNLPISSGHLVVENFGWAMLGGLLMGIYGMITERVFGLDEKVRVQKVREVEVRYVVDKKRADLDRDFYRATGEPPPEFPPPMPPGEGDPGYGDKPKRR